MTILSYIESSEKVLKEFENTQEHMLYRNLAYAAKNFRIQNKNMVRFLDQISKDLETYSFKNSKDQVLVTKQVEKLRVFLKEMELHIFRFHSKPPPDEHDIIFVFERQYVFKKMYRKHLSDIADIMN
jgi:hypothetical protein